MLFAALGLVGLVALLHHAGKSSSGEGQPGASNGVTIDDAKTPARVATVYNPMALVGVYGATGSPSPFTGLGSPSANMGYKSLLYLQKAPGGPRFNALQRSPVMRTTGLLDPLPDAGTRSKQLVTKDVIAGPGRKI